MSKISELYMMETEKEDNQDDEIIRQEIRQFLEKNGISISAEKKTGKSSEDLAFNLAEIGEEIGFIRGFKCAFRLFMECMKWKMGYAETKPHSPLKCVKKIN